MLEFNEQAVLEGPGSISNEAMQTMTHKRYEAFDANRRAEEARLADAEDLKALENLEKDLKRKGGKV
jgi:hypothetical protein